MADDDSNYSYVPSIAAAGIFIFLFILLFIIHLIRLIKTRTWFCVPFLLGALLEILGYIGRALGKSNPESTGPFIMQALLILLGPIFFAASIYMFLGRIVVATDSASYSLIRPTRLTKIFVGGDVLCFLIQAGGGGILAGSDSASSANIGKGVILVGLGLQMVIFAFFLVVAGVWQKRMNAGKAIVAEAFNWPRYMKMLYVASLLITFRNLFRVIEYAMGEEGYLLANEWPIYVFDAAPMVVVLVICALWYVGDITKQAGQYELGRLEQSEFDRTFGSGAEIRRDA